MTSYIDHLFSSSVQQAVALTVQQQKPLFVYLTKPNQEQEDGNAFLSKFIDEEVTQVLQSNFILLKLIENTPDFGYFTQLFKVGQLPSFYIVNLGKIEGIISTETDKDEFLVLVHTFVKSDVLGAAPAPAPNNETNNPQQSNAPTAGNIQPQVVPTHPSVSNPDTSRRTSLSEHDESARKYKEQVEKMRREKLEEKKRLRALLEADRRERALRMKEELLATGSGHPNSEFKESSPATTKSSSSSALSCFLSIKLFDGSTMKQEFKAEDTLSDVRKWLDSEVEIIRPASSMPSFATSAYLHPTGYVFHRPVLPRVTYLEEQESVSLKDLGLTPRSALILKPIYDEADANSPNASGERTGFFRSVISGVGKVGSALYSFFDYGVDAPYLQEQQEHQQQQQAQEHSRLDNLSRDGSDDFDDRQGSLSESQQFDLRNPSAIVAPGALAFDNRSASSLLINIDSNMEDDVISNLSRPLTPSHGSIDGHHAQRSLVSEVGSRSSTPRLQPSRRIQTIHDEAIESTSPAKDKKHIDTYNGNSLSLNEGDDENNKSDEL